MIATAQTHVTRLEASGAPAPGRRPSHSKETYIAALTAVCIAVSLILRFTLQERPVFRDLPLFVALLAGGLPLLIDLTRKLLARQFGTDLLAALSVTTSVVMGEYLVGAIVVLMLSGGAALEHHATRRASAVIDALARRMPATAHRKMDAGITEIAVADITIGERLVVLPHEICPADGVVVSGNGSMDESFLTGEPFQISKTPASEVLSSAVNGETALTIVVSRLPVDSRYAKIMQVMRASEQNRTPMRRIGDRIGAWYTPVAIAAGLASWIASGDAGRFLAVLVIATPCPVLIAIPVALIGGISLSARRGIVIKNPALLEQIDTCRTIIFDKTGTLTYGRPSLTEVLCAPGFSREQVLTAAASLEVYSRHPLAAAIVKAARDANLVLGTVELASEKPGEGLRGVVDGIPVEITGRSKLSLDSRTTDPRAAAKSAESAFSLMPRPAACALKIIPPALPPAAEGLECLVFLNGSYAAALRFHDEPRAESHPFVHHLKPRHGAAKVMLLSGDRESEVRYFANRLGIAEAHAGKSPEEKVAIIKEETRQAKTLYVGDGINDAPAMLNATVGVAFGKNSDITAEAADAVVLEPSLSKVDELIHIGRRTRSIAFQSALGGMALSAAGMIVAALGYLPPVAGAVTQELIDLAAVLNAVRVSLPARHLTDF